MIKFERRSHSGHFSPWLCTSHEAVLAPPSNEGVEIPDPWPEQDALEEDEAEQAALPPGEEEGIELGSAPPSPSTSFLTDGISTADLPRASSTESPLPSYHSYTPSDQDAADIHSVLDTESLRAVFLRQRELPASSSSSTWGSLHVHHSADQELGEAPATDAEPKTVDPAPAASPHCVRRIGSYTVEERRERIERFRAKRLRRNYRSSLRYPRRQALSAMRQRVHGRFTNNENDND